MGERRRRRNSSRQLALEAVARRAAMAAGKDDGWRLAAISRGKWYLVIVSRVKHLESIVHGDLGERTRKVSAIWEKRKTSEHLVAGCRWLGALGSDVFLAS